jgi:hypothetical protein
MTTTVHLVKNDASLKHATITLLYHVVFLIHFGLVAEYWKCCYHEFNSVGRDVATTTLLYHVVFLIHFGLVAE